MEHITIQISNCPATLPQYYCLSNETLWPIVESLTYKSLQASVARVLLGNLIYSISNAAAFQKRVSSVNAVATTRHSY